MTTVQQRPSALPLYEFIGLMALLSSIMAFSIDAILPALPQIAEDFSVSDINDVQLIVSAVIFGIGLGQLFYGPFCDSKGRKPTLYLGMTIFFLGSLCCLFAPNFELMLLGRFIQGFGLGATRVVSAALIRDTYHGRQMSQVMSLIMVLFILVPMIAPMVGQFILFYASWPMVFVVIATFAGFGVFWFAWRQPETLQEEYRKPFTFKAIGQAFIQVLTHKLVMICTLAQGLVFGAFLSYLVSSQAIFERSYQIVDDFPLYFAILAFSFGIGSFANSRLVLRHGMIKMITFCLPVFSVVSLLLLMLAIMNEGVPPFFGFVALTLPIFFTMNVMFPNFNTIAMQHMGHMAGVGAAVIGSISTMVGVACSVLIGQQFDGSLIFFYASYLIIAVILVGLVRYITKHFVEEHHH